MSLAELSWTNRAINLGENFSHLQGAETLPEVQLLHWNDSLAETLGFDKASWNDQEKAALFSGNETIPGSQSASFVYSGHQFGH